MFHHFYNKRYKNSIIVDMNIIFFVQYTQLTEQFNSRMRLIIKCKFPLTKCGLLVKGN